MKAFLRLIRYQNLLMIALMQLIFKYGFLDLQQITVALNDWQYLLLVLATVNIAAGGYIINNVFDQETDLINKPQNVVVGKFISENAAYNIYATMNIIGVGIAFYLSNYLGHPGLSTLFIVVAGTLYLYASSLKRGLLVGNLIVAIISSLSILVIGLFDLYPIITEENRLAMATLFEVMLDYALFCFIISFIRELVKDLEDVDGDYNTGMRTLPIVLGVDRTAKLIFGLSIIPILILLYYTSAYYIVNKLYFATAYTLLLIIGPLIYFTIKMWSARTKKHFHHLSNVLKLVLFFGILSILVVTLNIMYHA